eukprot:COSAG03_NODE_15128_length_440_cov_1.208211_1_plen_26_part_10
MSMCVLRTSCLLGERLLMLLEHRRLA